MLPKKHPTHTFTHVHTKIHITIRASQKKQIKQIHLHTQYDKTKMDLVIHYLINKIYQRKHTNTKREQQQKTKFLSHMQNLPPFNKRLIKNKKQKAKEKHGKIKAKQVDVIKRKVVLKGVKGLKTRRY